MQSVMSELLLPSGNLCQKRKGLLQRESGPPSSLPFILTVPIVIPLKNEGPAPESACVEISLWSGDAMTGAEWTPQSSTMEGANSYRMAHVCTIHAFMPYAVSADQKWV